MSEKLKQQLVELTQKRLENLSHEERRSILWHVLVYEIAGKPGAMEWIMKAVHRLMDDEEKRLFSPFQ